MDIYPKPLVNQYLRACLSLKQSERAVIKRFGPNIHEVLAEFYKLAIDFEEAGIYQYAAMCQMGAAKCNSRFQNSLDECQALLKAARLFLKAHEEGELLMMRSNSAVYRDTALHCFKQAIDKCPDVSVMKAAIIREMTPLQPHNEVTSTFNSPAHRIYELEFVAELFLRKSDYLRSLQKLDDIVDNIYERKKEHLYTEVLAKVEILRVLLLVALDLPPAQQIPAYIKLIEYYIELAEFKNEYIASSSPQSPLSQTSESWRPGVHLSQLQNYALAEIVRSWHFNKPLELKVALQEFRHNFISLTDTHRYLINSIIQKVDKKC